MISGAKQMNQNLKILLETNQTYLLTVEFPPQHAQDPYSVMVFYTLICEHKMPHLRMRSELR
jgi:hypothetical protein